jgi:hypothetical protein
MSKLMFTDVERPLGETRCGMAAGLSRKVSQS